MVVSYYPQSSYFCDWFLFELNYYYPIIWLLKVYALKPVEFIWSEKKGNTRFPKNVITFVNIFKKIWWIIWILYISERYGSKTLDLGRWQWIGYTWYTIVAKFIMFIILKWLKFGFFFSNYVHFLGWHLS